MDNWEAIRKEWETTKITLADLAEKYDIKLGTLKSRKSREKWSRDATKKDATKIRKVASTKKDETKQKEVVESVEVIDLDNDEFTDKQRLFCIYYVKYFNATKAYQKAYGCDYMAANASGSRLLANVSIQQEIKRLKQQRLNEAYFDKYDVLQKYKDIAFADITDYTKFGRQEEIEYGEDGQPKLDMNGNIKTYAFNYIHLNESADIDGTILTEVKQGKDGITIKLADKMKALEFLAKYTDLLDENERKQLQEEKIKMDIEKAKAEVKSIDKTGDKGTLKIEIDYGDES